MTDITDDSLILHFLHVLRPDDPEIPSRSHIDICPSQSVLDSQDAKPFHRGLQGADRVNLCHNNLCPLSLQCLRATLAHVPIATDHRNLTGDHDICRPFDPVDQGLSTPVEVIKFRLCH